MLFVFDPSAKPVCHIGQHPNAERGGYLYLDTKSRLQRGGTRGPDRGAGLLFAPQMPATKPDQTRSKSYNLPGPQLRPDTRKPPAQLPAPDVTRKQSPTSWLVCAHEQGPLPMFLMSAPPPLRRTRREHDPRT